VVSSREPLSIRSGVVFVSAAAGRGHGAAADAGGHVYTWGTNERGQCGVQPGSQPVISHPLPPPPAADAEGAAGNAAAAGSRRFGKIDSLDTLESSLRLPGSLLQALPAQRSLQRAACGGGESPEPLADAVAPAAGIRSAAAAAAAPPPAATRQLHVYRLNIGQAVHMVACGRVSGAGSG
jgi:hypothetical protein